MSLWQLSVENDRAIVYKDGVKQYDSNAFGPVIPPKPIEPPVLVPPVIPPITNPGYPVLNQNYTHKLPIVASIFALPLKSRGTIQITALPPTSSAAQYEASISKVPGDFSGKAPYAGIFNAESGGFTIMPAPSPYYPTCVVPENEQWYFNLRPVGGSAGTLVVFYG